MILKEIYFIVDFKLTGLTELNLLIESLLLR